MASVKILFCSDTHLGFDYPVRGNNHRRRRGQSFFKSFEEVLKQARNQKVDLVIHGGDLFYRSRMPQKIIDKVYAMLFDFVDEGIPIAIIPGNHERSQLPPSLYLEHPGITIFEHPSIKEYSLQGYKIQLGGFPFVKGDIRSAFPGICDQLKYDPDAVKLLVMHHAIDGARVNRHFTFNNRPDTINIQNLPPVNAVLCGHIHPYQILYHHTIHHAMPVIYCGSTQRTSFAEQEEAKGFVMLTIEQNKPLSYQFHPLPVAPMITIDIIAANSMPEALEQLKQEAQHLPAQSTVRIKTTMYLSKMLTKDLLNTLFPDNMALQIKIVVN